MKTSLLKYLSNAPTHKFNRDYRYRRKRLTWLHKHKHKGCYLCGQPVIVHQTERGVKHPHNMMTLDHYVPVWFLKAIKLPEGIIHPPNFRVCCHRCNYLRGLRVTTVAELRADVGDELVDKLMAISGVHLPDDYHYELKTPAE